MRRSSGIFLLIVFGLWLILPAQAQTPTIRAADGALNGASYARSGLPNGGIAQGSIFVIFGDNLGPATLVQVSAFPLPTTEGLAGTSVTVTVGQTTVTAIMLYTLKTQVAAVLPSNTPLGPGTVRVRYNGQDSNPVPIRVVARSFGTFALNQAGSGPAIIQNVNSEADRPINAFDHPARPGQVMILWGTGIGPVSGNEPGGALPGNMPGVNTRVFVGSKEASIQYRGRSGCCVGVDQIVFTIPEGVEGCYIPVSVVVDNVVSNYVTIAIARTGNVCSDPGGYSSSQWQTLLSGQNVRIGTLAVQRILNRNLGGGIGGDGAPYRSDYITAAYSSFSSSALLKVPGQPPIGSCAVMQFPLPSFVIPGALGAGAVIVNGPVGNRAIPMSSTGVYQLLFAPTFPAAPNIVTDGTLVTAGTYAFNVTAGANVGAHSASINHPATFTWNELASFPGTINRNQPFTVTWTGGTAGALVYIYGQSAYDSGPQGDVGASFQCTADGGAGTFTIPASVLSALPPTYSVGPAGPHGSFFMSQYIFGQPLSIPGTDIGTISVADINTIYTVAYQ